MVRPRGASFGRAFNKDDRVEKLGGGAASDWSSERGRRRCPAAARAGSRGGSETEGMGVKREHWETQKLTVSALVGSLSSEEVGIDRIDGDPTSGGRACRRRTTSRELDSFGQRAQGGQAELQGHSPGLGDARNGGPRGLAVS
jgi:hypothetical protein